jgi:anti-sigma regulatory factor (Ser/Thr protein kinase)
VSPATQDDDDRVVIDASADWQRTIDPSHVDLPALRSEMTDVLRRAGVSEPQLHDVVLVASELLNNGREAGGDDAQILLRLVPRAPLITVEVTNTVPPGRASVFNAQVCMPGPQAERGRGLALVSMLSARLSVEPHQHATSVRAEILWRHQA